MHENLLDRDDTLLIVVDMQEPFLRNIFERERVIKNVIKLIETAKILEIPIVTTLQHRAKMGDVIPEIAAAFLDNTRIDKTTFSCCGVEEFDNAVFQPYTMRNTLLICGVETHICISQTAHDLEALSYKVHVAVDAVSSRRESDHLAGLDKMRQSGVILTPTEAAIYELLKDAADPAFKKILELVK